ncbi:MAG TPA: hypothetical protein VFI09_01435 [Solirubrobacterales bacterium]|nr:hypothetical protein [Solirubrobacterales bacterium]
MTSIRVDVSNGSGTGRALAILAVALLGALCLSASFGVATSEAKIYACKKKETGALRIVSRHTKCRKNETKLSWGARGKHGKQGRQGQPGPAGPAGGPGPGGPSSYVALGPLTINSAQGKVTLYDLGYGVQIQVQCSGDQTNLTPEVFVTNTAENTYLSAFSAGPSYSAPIREKMATAVTNSKLVSAGFSSTGTASVSSQVFISVFQLSDASVPKVFYATVVPWAEAQTTTCKFAGGLTRVAG